MQPPKILQMQVHERNDVQVSLMELTPEFIIFMQEEYKKKLRVDKAIKDLQDMAEEMKGLTAEQVKAKFPNPSREWALRQFELIKARRGVQDKNDSSERYRRGEVGAPSP